MATTDNRQPLIWSRRDIEQRFGFQGGRFTRVNTLLSMLCAAVATIAIYSAVVFWPGENFVRPIFMDRGFTPYVMTFLFSWALVIIAIKWSKLRFQRQSLSINVIPSNPDFVLSVVTVEQVLSTVMRSVDDSRSFVVFNRVFTALSNLRNLGRIADVDEMLRSQAELDENGMETSYSLLRGFIWAIPVLGFIGTVMGLSIAIGGFGEVLATTTDPSALSDSLKGVTGGLSTAFETTLLALIFALMLQLAVTFLHKAEQEFLDECTEYCQKNIVGKLRMMPFDTQSE